MPYKHVLAAVDLSDEAAQVLEKAQLVRIVGSPRLRPYSFGLVLTWLVPYTTRNTTSEFW